MLRTGLLAVALVAASSRADAGFVLASTGFEVAEGAPAAPANGFLPVPTGTALGGGFRVTAGSVDILSPTFYGMSGAVGQSIDLNGSGPLGTGFPGAVAVTIDLVAGQAYTVEFLAGVNNDGGTPPKTATIFAGATQIGAISRGVAGTPSGSFTAGSVRFVAAASGATDIEFRGDAADGQFGVLLDGLRVSSVSVPAPAPAGLLVLAGAAPLLALARRRLCC